MARKYMHMSLDIHLYIVGKEFEFCSGETMDPLITAIIMIRNDTFHILLYTYGAPFLLKAAN